MITVNDSLVSCGVGQVYNLEGSVRNHINDLAEAMYLRKYITVVFSDAENWGNGKRLAKALKPHGEIKTTKQATNPRTGHTIQTWLFTASKSFIEKGRKRSER